MNVLIVLGGEKPSPALALQARQRAHLVIAADSGFHALDEADIQPDILTGDFDSIGDVLDTLKLRVIPAPEQDATDFEKALRLLPENTASVEILGGTGMRSDHFLTNLLIAAGLSPCLAVVFNDNTQSIHRITPEFPLSINAHPGKVVSLIPFTTCEGVSTTGLHWDLTQAEMGPSSQLGQSNIVDSDHLDITITGGILYLVVNHVISGS